MSSLRSLSRRFGVVDEYIDQSGTERRATSDATRIALLRAMGVDAGTEAAAEAFLAALDAAARAEPMPLVAVLREEASARVDIGGDHRGAEWRLRVRVEGGEERVREGRGAATVDIGTLPCGYHELELEIHGAKTKQRRIVTPSRCPSVAEATGLHRAFGISAQLFAVRSRRNWGIGDTGDIDLLVDRAAAWGAAFVGLNPLHALGNQGGDVSPYSPISRLFGNWIYIDVAAVPEHDGTEPAEIEALRAASRIDYDHISALKLAALRKAYDRFVTSGSEERTRAFDAFLTSGGPELRYFTLFAAMTPADRERYTRPDAPGIETLERTHADVRFHGWLQFELDRQLRRAAARARTGGLGIGLYQDLAIGCAPDGSDVWAHPNLFVPDVAIGAPPDGYSVEGQNWGLPPMSPHRLRADGYRYWTTLLRRAFAHGGALRMDHVIGLFRQFWIPNGKSGKEGAFVAFPAEDLLGVLALEATRARAVVVGEDLGTVPKEVPGVLARYGVLSSRVLYFEMTNREFHPAARYPENALTTANTHDMAPLEGWVQGKDIALKEQVGIVDTDAADRARAERREDVAALRRRLSTELGEEVAESGEAFVGAVHDFLARTPSALVGLALDDIGVETEPVNVPGASPDQHPSWRRRYRTSLEDLPTTSAALPASLRERGSRRGAAS